MTVGNQREPRTLGDALVLCLVIAAAVILLLLLLPLVALDSVSP